MVLAHHLTFLEENMCDDCSAQGAGGISGAVLSQRPKTGLTEDVIAWVAHVRTEVHIQADSADVALSVPGSQGLIVLTAAAGWVSC